ncbi:MAG: carbohydrate binding domain-containing protein [Bacteroidota bacterium]
MNKYVVSLFFLFIEISAQNFSGGFNFYLPSSDTSTQKFLPGFPIIPINDNDFISIDAEGHFTRNGSRIRFWGTNFVADAAFPSSPNISGLLAGRLRKFGFNLVRMHHLDNPWSNRSMVGKTYTRELNLTYLGLLENIIARLKENGIYINMNLHVSRTFGQFDQVADYDSLPEFGKGVNYFDPYIKNLHEEYARQLLTHVNPYTGKALVDDPVLAMVEITNENSLYRFWRDDQLKPIKNGGVLPYRYSKMLDSLWNEFLLNKYGTTQKLVEAWNKNLLPSGLNEQIKNGGFEKNNPENFWALEEHSSADADTLRDNSTSNSGSYSFKVAVKNATGTDWHIQYKQPALRIKKDSTYTVSFAARSDAEKSIGVSVMNDQSPWNGYAWNTIELTNEWKVFTFSFKAPEDNSHTRLSFSLGKTTAVYWFDDISFTNAGSAGIENGESLEQKTIARIDYSDCVGYTAERVKDISEFYIKLQRDFFTEMKNFLKDSLGVKVPIVGTNWNVGPADLISMSDVDYVDNHAYWDHPQFPNVPWSPTDWLINNTPMVKDANGGTIPALFAGVPIKGKPFTVSEYNETFPNRYQVESILFSTGYSSFNDVDALMYFAYDESYQWEKDFVDGYFGINRNSVYLSFFPTTAYVFRNGLIKPSVSPVTINYNIDTLYSLPKHDGSGWEGPSFYDKKISLEHAVKTENYFSESTTNFDLLPAAPTNPFVTDTGELTWNNSEGTFSIVTPKFNGITGFLSGFKGERVGEMFISDFKDGDFGTVTWLSLTDLPLGSTDYSLVTIGSRIQNTNMIWNSGNTSVNNNWGKSPTKIYPLSIKLDLAIYADSIRVYPLDNKGKESESTSFVVKPFAVNHFLIELDQSVYKTLWFGIRRYGDQILPGVEDENELPDEFRLEQNYPNPFNPETTIEYAIPNVETRYSASPKHITLKIYDILGREIATLVDKQQLPGKYSVLFNVETRQGTSLPSGIYFYKLTAGEFTAVKKLLLLK